MDPAVNMPVNNWDGNPLKDALMRLGLTDVAAREFMENGVVSIQQLRMLTDTALTRLIKQIHRDNNGGAGLQIPLCPSNIFKPSDFGLNASIPSAYHLTPLLLQWRTRYIGWKKCKKTRKLA